MVFTVFWVGQNQAFENLGVTWRTFGGAKKICNEVKAQSLYFNPLVPNAPFLYLLKISENLTVFLFSGGRERMHWEQVG